MGMVVIGMALGASFGSCFYLGLFFSDMHPCLPFLLLGIGVDDMFVIVQAVENLSASERKLPIDQRVGKAMRHAGVSITVTSVTDMAAFLIGSTSVRISAQWLKTTKMSHFLQNSSNVVSFFNSFFSRNVNEIFCNNCQNKTFFVEFPPLCWSFVFNRLTNTAIFLLPLQSMPILRHFCLFAAMGVFFLYIFAITFFVG